LYFNNLANTAKDSLVNVEKLHQVQKILLKEERRQQEAEVQKIASENRLKQWGLMLGLLFLTGFTVFLYRNNRQKQKLNEQLAFQKNEIENLNNGLEIKVEERTAELQQALIEVQSAFSKGQTTERKRVSADLHDEIGSALSTIAIFSDLTKMKAQKAAPELVGELDRIGAKSRDMIQTMRDTIWTLNEDSAQPVWERMYLSSLETLNAKDIELKWQMPSDIDLPDLPFETKRNLFLAFKEAINNIVKHAHTPSVFVEGICQNDIFILKIKDNGKGFDENTLKNRGSGLSNFEKRMDAIGGTVSIESALNDGTSIIFTFPLIT
jgi:signal transduction histidine kinase